MYVKWKTHYYSPKRNARKRSEYFEPVLVREIWRDGEPRQEVVARFGTIPFKDWWRDIWLRENRPDQYASKYRAGGLWKFKFWWRTERILAGLALDEPTLQRIRAELAREVPRPSDEEFQSVWESACERARKYGGTPPASYLP